MDLVRPAAEAKAAAEREAAEARRLAWEEQQAREAAWQEWVGWLGDLVTLQWVGGVAMSVARALGAERCCQCAKGKVAR